MNRIVAALVGALTTSFVVSMAAAQAPGNRQAHTLSIVPDPAGTGQQIIAAHWTVDVEATADPLDYSTEVLLFIGRSLVDTRTESITIDGGSGGSCPFGPPCNGTCGSATLNGASVALHCYEECGPVGCDCDCGLWISTEFPPMTIATGEVVSVVLQPVPGTAPDNDDTDNGVDEPWEGDPLAWNRSVDGLELTEVAGGGYDVEAHGTFSFHGPSGRLNLDGELELRVNGVAVSSIGIPAQADQIYDQGCFTVGCGNQCGAINGIPAFCDSYLWWDCGCGGGWLGLFESVPLVPGDEIMILLRPAPGALPELPGLGGDDEIEDIGILAVGDGASMVVPPRLAQNRPNPFTPRTAIGFELDHAGHARLEVMDVAGRLVTTLLDRPLSDGRWSVSWDGRSADGRQMSPGTYFYRLTVDGAVTTRTMTLVR